MLRVSFLLLLAAVASVHADADKCIASLPCNANCQAFAACYSEPSCIDNASCKVGCYTSFPLADSAAYQAVAFCIECFRLGTFESVCLNTDGSSINPSMEPTSGQPLEVTGDSITDQNTVQPLEVTDDASTDQSTSPTSTFMVTTFTFPQEDTQELTDAGASSAFVTSTEAPSTAPSKLAPCEESCEDLVEDCEDGDDCNEALTCATNQWEVDTQSCDQRCVVQCGKDIVGTVRRDFYHAARCFQRCLRIPVVPVFTVRSQLIFTGVNFAALQGNLALLKDVLFQILGFHVNILGVRELSARRRATGDVEVDYSFEAVGTTERDQGVTEVEELNTESGTTELVTMLATSFGADGANPFSSAGASGAPPVTSTSLPSESSSDADKSSGTIAGAVSGSLVAVMLVVIVVVLVRRNKARASTKAASTEDGHRTATYDNPSYSSPAATSVMDPAPVYNQAVRDDSDRFITPTYDNPRTSSHSNVLGDSIA